MSQKMSLGKFVAIGCLGILATIAIFHLTWAAPQLDRKQKLSDLVSAAHRVQVSAIQNYELLPGANASNIDLKRDFPDKGAIRRLVELSTETGITTDTDFNKETFGNALALSNFVLTGNDDPQFLTITDLEVVTGQRSEDLVDSVSLWPWF